jgi:Uma2 family endonuclease
MATITTQETLADLVAELGGIPLNRIRLRPPPGTATEHDVLDMEARKNRLCELVDGVLVEKTMGYLESLLAGAILAHLRAFVLPKNLGSVSGADGMMRLFPGLVRMPDVAYASWSRFPGGRLPNDPIPDLAPDLAVEVLSRSNTPAEMERKRREYFEAGVTVVWMVEPRQRTVSVFSSPEESVDFTEEDTLDGGDVLPGFQLKLRDLFAELDRHA